MTRLGLGLGSGSVFRLGVGYRLGLGIFALVYLKKFLKTENKILVAQNRISENWKSMRIVRLGLGM